VTPWKTTRFEIDLAEPRVMGIVNLTPDSFSDGDPTLTPGRALATCERLLAEGADMLDLGGESSRPGADPVDLETELGRLLPVLREALCMGCPVSVDTAKPEVMRAALDLGADIVNDIGALRAPGALEAVAAHPACGVCLMHMRGTPRSMQSQTDYADLIGEIGAFLGGRVAGVWATPAADRSAAQRVALDAASVAASLLAVQRGARIVRVHNVAAMVAALAVWKAAPGARG
jgi:dihydropteroate synthase